jgi:hypothetical protein
VWRLQKIFRRLILILAVVAMLCGLVFLLILWESGRLAFGPCIPGSERIAEGATGEARTLLETRNFEASRNAIGDLKAGIVDERLMTTLQTLTEEHRVCIDAFKEGHYFLPGVPDGPVIPDNYGEAGGLPNSHYYGRAADIRRINGKPVRDDGTNPGTLGVGDALTGIPPQERPDQIIGPESWAKALGGSSEEGWILDEDQLKLHKDHIHIGYMREDGTWNTR